MQEPTMTEKPMGFVDRTKAALGVMTTGKLPNPLASEPADKSRAALVSELNGWAKDTRAFWSPTFKRIREDEVFGAGNHWGDVKSADGSEPYQSDIVQRHLQQKEAALYARRPTFYAERRKRKEFKVWDGSEESLRGAQAILSQADQAVAQAAQAGVPLGQPPGEVVAAQAIVADYENGMKQRKLEEDLGDTLNLLFDHQLDAQVPSFKQSVKQLVTRINTCGVGYIKPMFRRTMQSKPTQTGAEEAGEMAYDVPESGMAARMAAIMQKAQEISESGDKESAAIAELEFMVRQLAEDGAEGEQVADEGIVITFPSATSILVDRGCTNLRGFIGAKRVAEEMLMDVADVERQFKCSLRDSGAVKYYDSGDPVEPSSGTASSPDKDAKGKAGKVCVWLIHDRATNLCYTVCDGVKDFLCEPCEPKLEWDFFWQIIPVTFRPVEVEKNDPESGVTCYPRSDVRLLRPMQQEINRSGEAFREHRIANRPRWAIGGAMAEDDDIATLSLTTPAGALLKLKTLAPGEKLADRLQPIPTAPIDPAVYDTGRFHQDALMVVGTQPANLGAPRSGDTATGEAIAEGSRIQSSDSNVDDLEDALSLLAQACGLLLMANMTPESVQRICGAGAVWPRVSMSDMQQNIWLEIEAGSTGRPNQALEVQNFQLLGPQLKEMMMAEGKSLEPLIKEGARRLDDKLDTADFLKPTAMPPKAPPGAPMIGVPGAAVPGGIPPGQVATNVPAVAPTQPTPPPLPPMSAAIAKESATA